jgi:hypothetical protein
VVVAGPDDLDIHSYLEGLDIRVSRLRAIVDPPTSRDLADHDDDAPSIVETLARLFDVAELELVDELGDDWAPIGSDEWASRANPCATWPGRAKRWLLWVTSACASFGSSRHMESQALER